MVSIHCLFVCLIWGCVYGGSGTQSLLGDPTIAHNVPVGSILLKNCAGMNNVFYSFFGGQPQALEVFSVLFFLDGNLPYKIHMLFYLVQFLALQLVFCDYLSSTTSHILIKIRTFLTKKIALNYRAAYRFFNL